MDSLETEEDMRNFLQFAYDMDEETVAALNKEELQGMIKSLNMSMNIPDSNDDAMEAQSPTPKVTILSPVELPPPPADDYGRDATPVPPAPMVDNTGEEAIIAEFCECTGSDRTSARYLLEMCGFDLEAAIPLYFGSESPQRHEHPGVQPAASSTTDDSHGLNPGVVENMDGGTSDLTGIHESIRNMINNPTLLQHGPMIHSMLRSHGYQTMMHDGDDSDGEGGSGGGYVGLQRKPKVDQYDEDGVRLPDKAEHHQLVYGGFRGDSEEDILARADDPNVEWMFPPPRHLSYMGSLEQAREIGVRENRWILVNIQSHSEFTSHLLNRDVWTNETIESLFRTSYLFWQRGHTCRDGQDYMMRYKLTEDDLPYIGFIDPRTGAKKLNLSGSIDASDLAIRMIEFIDAHPLNCAPSLNSGGASSSSTGNPSPASLADISNSKATPSDRMWGSTASAGGGAGAGAGAAEEGKMEAGSSARTEGSSVSGFSSISQSTNATNTSNTVSGGAGNTLGIAARDESKGGDSPVYHNYGEAPEEPAESADAIKVSIKLTSGKQVVRRFLKSHPVSALYAVALQLVPEAANRRFDLATRYPAASLSDRLTRTLAKCDLANSQVIMKWN